MAKEDLRNGRLKYESWCHKNGIIAYPQVIKGTRGKVRIMLNYKGTPQPGKDLYKQKKLKKGDIKYWDKIDMIYKHYYDKEHKNT